MGNGISQGQWQWLFIVCVIYKIFDFLFFDEAINVFDVNNECEIVNNLDCFFEGWIVVVVVYCLSIVSQVD